MKITLGDKTYEQSKLKGRIFRRFLEVQEILNESEKMQSFKTDDLDLMVGFISEVFEHKFTSDDVYDELELDEIIPAFTKIARGINTKSQSKMSEFQKK